MPSQHQEANPSNDKSSTVLLAISADASLAILHWLTTMPGQVPGPCFMHVQPWIYYDSSLWWSQGTKHFQATGGAVSLFIHHPVLHFQYKKIWLESSGRQARIVRNKKHNRKNSHLCSNVRVLLNQCLAGWEGRSTKSSHSNPSLAVTLFID